MTSFVLPSGEEGIDVGGGMMGKGEKGMMGKGERGVEEEESTNAPKKIS